MNEMNQWSEEFKQKNYDSKNETILFDISCGDFNLDNMSPGIIVILIIIYHEIRLELNILN
jgi:hypothetical protein